MMRLIHEVMPHMAMSATEIFLHGVSPLATFSAFVTAILTTVIRLGNRVTRAGSYRSLVMLWALTMGTIVTWVVGVLAFRAVGLIRE